MTAHGRFNKTNVVLESRTEFESCCASTDDPKEYIELGRPPALRTVAGGMNGFNDATPFPVEEWTLASVPVGMVRVRADIAWFSVARLSPSSTVKESKQAC
jgi:hypothetical protein